MTRRIWLLLALLLPGAAAAQQRPAQPSWPAAAFNPRPDPADLVLPMPCGGGMAFRPVDTPTGAGAL